MKSPACPASPAISFSLTHAHAHLRQHKNMAGQGGHSGQVSLAATERQQPRDWFIFCTRDGIREGKPRFLTKPSLKLAIRELRSKGFKSIYPRKGKPSRSPLA